MIEVTEKNIWNFRQNNPELIIQDAKKYLGLDNEQQDILRQILLSRGVNKWFKVRRDLIAFKNALKKIIDPLTKEMHFHKSNQNWVQQQNLKGSLKAIHLIRGHLKSYCMSDRLVHWNNSGRQEIRKHTEIKSNDLAKSLIQNMTKRDNVDLRHSNL